MPRFVSLTIAILVCLSSVAAYADDVKKVESGVPAEIKDSKDKLVSWVKSFKTKTEKEVVDILGKESEREIWIHDGKKDFTLEFKLDNHTSLKFYFYDEKVISASLHISSEV